MIISIDAEKSFDKIQLLFLKLLIKTKSRKKGLQPDKGHP